MFDILQSGLNQEHSGEFSFHLWTLQPGNPTVLNNRVGVPRRPFGASHGKPPR